MWSYIIWMCSSWHFKGSIYQITRCHVPEDCNLSIQIIKNLKPYILVFLSRHSLLATRLVSEMNEELGLQLSISDMLQHCTLQSMASFIENPTVNKAGVNIDIQAMVDMHSQDKPPWVALLCSRHCCRHAFTVQGSVICSATFCRLWYKCIHNTWHCVYSCIQ